MSLQYRVLPPSIILGYMPCSIDLLTLFYTVSLRNAEYASELESERTVARNLNVSQNVPRPSLQQLVADNVVRLLQERGAATRPVAR